MAFQILMVEDDPEICEVVRDYFQEKSNDTMKLHFAGDGDRAMELLYETEYDLVLLDVMVPRVSGFDICKYLRRESDIPIIFVTARSRQEDVLRGYELGADDYVVKPFSLAELYAKVNALLKRSKGMVCAEEMVCGQICLNPLTLQVFVGQTREEISLPAKEYHMLRLLMERAGKSVSRDFLLSRIWGVEFEGNERVVDNHVKKLRKALGEYGGQIHTVFGRGYCLRENDRRE